jgi:[CysO sulfur-carrier protein]-S-L-cysteine hydrolase
MTKAQWDGLIAHAREEAPNECCGYLRAKDGLVEEVFRAENERKSPYGFSLSFDALQAVNDLPDEGFEVGIYHSPTTASRSASITPIRVARPSRRRPTSTSRRTTRTSPT